MCFQRGNRGPRQDRSAIAPDTRAICVGPKKDAILVWEMGQELLPASQEVEHRLQEERMVFVIPAPPTSALIRA